MTHAPKTAKDKRIAALKTQVKDLKNKLRLALDPAFHFELGLDRKVRNADEAMAHVLEQSTATLNGLRLDKISYSNATKLDAIFDHYGKGTPYRDAADNIRILQFDKTGRHFELSFRAQRDRRDRLRGFNVTGKEVTHHYLDKILEASRRGMRAHYKAIDRLHLGFLLAYAKTGSKDFTRSTFIAGLTDGMAQSLGYTIKEIPGLERKLKPELNDQPVSCFLPRKTIRALNASLKTGNENWIDGEIIARDGSRRAARLSIISYQGTRENRPDFSLMIMDRTKDEHVLRVLGTRIVESEEKCRSLFEDANDPILLRDFDGNILDCNQCACDTFGYTRDEMLHLGMQRLVSEKDHQTLEAFNDRLKRDRHARVEGKNRCRDGSTVDIQASGSVVTIGGRDLVHVIVRNVTERKRQERRLEYLLGIEELMAGIYGRYVGINPLEIYRANASSVKALGTFVGADRCCLFRFSKQNVELHNTIEWCADGIEPLIEKHRRIPSKDMSWLTKQLSKKELINIPRVAGLSREAATFKKFLTGRGVRSFVAMPLNMRHPIGFLCLSSVRAERVWTAEEIALLRRVSRTILSAIERRGLTSEVHRSEERYRNLIENLDAGLLILWGRRIVLANKNTGKMFGRPPDVLTNMSLRQLFTQEAWASIETQLCIVEANEDFVSTFEVQAIGADGGRMTIEISATRIVFDEKDALELIVRDVTKTRLLQQQLQRTARLASVGTLAAGVAHEINNPLAVISVDLLRMKQHVADTELVSKLCAKLMRMTRRIAGITGGLLKFSKASGDLYGKHPVAQSLDRALDLVGSRFDYEHKHLARTYPKRLPSVRCDSEQLQQVFVNLCINALEAMQLGDTLTVSAKTNRRSGTVTLQFTDTGKGMTRQEIDRAFDPFFTTKEMGTGLGLAISYNIIDEHDGNILIESKPGTGTTISIVLPVATRTQARTPRTARRSSKKRGTP